MNKPKKMNYYETQQNVIKAIEDALNELKERNLTVNVTAFCYNVMSIYPVGKLTILKILNDFMEIRKDFKFDNNEIVFINKENKNDLNREIKQIITRSIVTKEE